MTVKITKAPEGQTNGDLMYQFLDTVNGKGETFEFPSEQNHLYVLNEGTEDIEVRAGDLVRTLRPRENFGKEIDFSKVRLKSLAEDKELTIAFSVYATQYKMQGQAKVEGIETEKPATNATGGEENK